MNKESLVQDYTWNKKQLMLNTTLINGLTGEIFFTKELILIINIIKKTQMAVLAFAGEVAEKNWHLVEAAHHVLFLTFDPCPQ